MVPISKDLETTLKIHSRRNHEKTDGTPARRVGNSENTVPERSFSSSFPTRNCKTYVKIPHRLFALV
jgi:hypothetical protein